MNGDDFQTMTPPPSDDRLIDYLIGESVDHPSTGERSSFGGEISDAAIERWLAADEANVRRLESLASAVLAAALPTADGGFAGRDALAADAPRGDDHAVPRSPVVVVHSHRLGVSAAAVGLLAFAATIAMMIFWAPDPAPSELSTQRVAAAWAERFSTPSTASSAHSNLDSTAAEIDEDWSGDWGLAEAEEWLPTEASDTLADEYDSPPQWLVTALAGMSADSDFDSLEAEVEP